MRLLALGLSCLAACGAPSPPSGTGSLFGGPGSGVVILGTAGASGAGGAGGAAGSGGFLGACNNESDLAAIGTGPLVRNVSADCAFRCTESPDFDLCVNQCITIEISTLSPDLTLSLDCAGCYASLERCVLGIPCTTQCQIDPCVFACLGCPGYESCIGELQSCSGLADDGCEREGTGGTGGVGL